jgi:HPt (histidine-containing phosphotransfer) domain-containing protein
MQTSTQSVAEIQQLLDELWQRYLPSTQARLDILDRAVKVCTETGLDEETRAEAQSAAHKLSGNLGMFGHKEAGEVAGSIEHIFMEYSQDKASNLEGLMQRLHSLLQPHMENTL